MKKLDLYKTLGIDRSATPEQVKSAYRKRAMKAHPDRGGSAEEFTKINHANIVLSDLAKRSKYDRTGEIDEDSPENAMTAPLAIIIGFISQAAAQHSQGQGGDPCQADLIALMRRQFNDVISKMETGKKTMTKVSDKMKKIADRMKAKSDKNSLLLRAIRTQADSIAGQISQNDQQITAHKDAIAMLDGFTFDAEKKPPDHFPTSNFFTNRTFGGPFG